MRGVFLLYSTIHTLPLFFCFTSLHVHQDKSFVEGAMEGVGVGGCVVLCSQTLGPIACSFGQGVTEEERRAEAIPKAGWPLC